MDMFSTNKYTSIRKVFKYIFIISIICCVLLNCLTLSPQWCISKEQIWHAEEVDLTLYVSGNYKTEFYECFKLFDRDELSQYVTGELKNDKGISNFRFGGEDNFKWVSFGDYNNDENKWIVTGEFKLVYNCKKIKFIVNRIYGDIFPKDIKQLTFVPEDI